MSDAEALLAAVLHDPLDDVPRLVYADWLEETDDPVQVARAELIRLQCDMAHGPQNTAAVIRQHLLLTDYSAAWLAPLKRHGQPLVGPSTHGMFRRGFVEIVWMRANVFLKKSETLFRSCPVTDLRITQATPAELAAIVRMPVLAKLQVFDVAVRGVAEAFVQSALKSPHLSNLPRVSLRNCGLNDEAALQLADVPFVWPLESLDVSHNGGPGGLTSVGLTALQRRFGAKVVHSNGRP